MADSKFTAEYCKKMRQCAVFLKDNGGDVVVRECADEIDRLRNALEAAPVGVVVDELDTGHLIRACTAYNDADRKGPMADPRRMGLALQAALRGGRHE